MPIPVQTIIDRCTALLDAEGSDHYKFDKDFKPAINNAQVWLMNLYNRLFGEKKISEESLSELTVIKVFKASVYSRLSFSNQGVTNSKLLDADTATNNDDGTVNLVCEAHGFNVGDFVTISGSIDYNGTFKVQGVADADNFSILISEALSANDWNDGVSVTITRVDATATVVHANHGLQSDSEVTIAGAVQTEYNGTFVITRIDSGSYSYTVSGTPATPATGTITSTTVFSAETFQGTETAIVDDKVWSILALYPSIETIPAIPTGLPLDDQTGSELVTTVAMRKPLAPAATRLTLAEWAEKEVNPIIPGSPLVTKSNLIRYAYLNHANYSVGVYELGDANLELEIAPDVKNDLVALAYLRQPVDITAVTDVLPFPKSLEVLVVMKTLNFVAFKDDDRQDLYNISEEEVSRAVQLLS